MAAGMSTPSSATVVAINRLCSPLPKDESIYANQFGEPGFFFAPKLTILYGGPSMAP